MFIKAAGTDQTSWVFNDPAQDDPIEKKTSQAATSAFFPLNVKSKLDIADYKWIQDIKTDSFLLSTDQYNWIKETILQQKKDPSLLSTVQNIIAEWNTETPFVHALKPTDLKMFEAVLVIDAFKNVPNFWVYVESIFNILSTQQMDPQRLASRMHYLKRLMINKKSWTIIALCGISMIETPPTPPEDSNQYRWDTKTDRQLAEVVVLLCFQNNTWVIPKNIWCQTAKELSEKSNFPFKDIINSIACKLRMYAIYDTLVSNACIPYTQKKKCWGIIAQCEINRQKLIEKIGAIDEKLLNPNLSKTARAINVLLNNENRHAWDYS